MTWDHIPDAPTENFNVFLHELRTRELRRMPPGGKTVLSGGAAGRWYFEWMKDCYPSLTKHIGVEAYQAKPADLPPEAVWIANYLGNMHDVQSCDVDLVFAGQTVEHMWPVDLANFLCESHRVLRPDGVLVLDSPNRRLTRAMGWYHVQHTVELTVDEITAMVTAAGFDRIEVRGVWLCYSSEDHTLLPIDPLTPVTDWPWKRRVALSSDRPEDCFVWWLEARRATQPADRDKVLQIAQIAYDEAFAAATRREFVAKNVKPEGSGLNRVFRVNQGEGGFVNHGPYIPLRPGNYRVQFALGLANDAPAVAPSTIACELDVITDYAAKTHAKKTVTVGELKRGELTTIELPFTLKETGFGCEFRILSHGSVPLVIRSNKELIDVDHLQRVFNSK